MTKSGLSQEIKIGSLFKTHLIYTKKIKEKHTISINAKEAFNEI